MGARLMLISLEFVVRLLQSPDLSNGGRSMLTGNALIGQSGGPTCVINASLVGLVETLRKNKRIGRVFGMRFGIEGVLGDFLLDLSAEKSATLNELKTTPSSALGSSRHKLKDPD